MGFLRKIFFRLLLLLFLATASFIGYLYYTSDKPLLELAQDFTKTIIRDESNTPLRVLVNTDTNSNLALVAQAPNKESFAVFTKIENNTEFIDRMVIEAQDESLIAITFNNQSLPAKMEYNYHTVLFTNYRENRVDLKITKPDGSTESLPNSVITDLSLSVLPLVTVAHAFEVLGVDPTIGITRQTINDGDDAGVTDYLMSSAGTALHIISCGVALGTTVGSAGASSPLAYLGCAGLGARLATAYTTIGPCDGDILDCAVNTIKASFKTRGPVIAGIIRDAQTNDPIAGAQLLVRNKLGELKARAISSTHGHYVLPSIDLGGYTLEVKSAIHESQNYILAMTENRIQINSESAGNLDTNYVLGERSYFRKIPGYYGRELNAGHNVRFDITLGMTDLNDGSWSGTAQSTQAVVVNPNDSSDETYCADATFTWDVSGASLRGTAIIDEDYSAQLKGRIDAAGTITAGSGIGLYELISFTGQLKNNQAHGTFSTKSGCSGTWQAQKDTIAPANNEAMPVL